MNACCVHVCALVPVRQFVRLCHACVRACVHVCLYFLSVPELNTKDNLKFDKDREKVDELLCVYMLMFI